MKLAPLLKNCCEALTIKCKEIHKIGRALSQQTCFQFICISRLCFVSFAIIHGANIQFKTFCQAKVQEISSNSNKKLKDEIQAKIHR